MGTIIECKLKKTDKPKVARTVPENLSMSSIVYTSQQFNLGVFFNFQNLEISNGTLFQKEDTKVIFYCDDSTRGYHYDITSFVIHYFLNTPGLDLKDLYNFLQYKNFRRIQYDKQWKAELINVTRSFICDLIQPNIMLGMIKRCEYTFFNKVCEMGLRTMMNESKYTNGQINDILSACLKAEWHVDMCHALYIMEIITKYQIVCESYKHENTTTLYINGISLEPIFFPQPIFFMLLCVLAIDGNFDITTLPID